MIKRIGCITAGRSDFGIYLPVLRALREDSGFEPVVVATGTHMDARFGQTVRAMESAGFDPAFRVPMVPECDGSSGTVQAMGQGMCELAEVFDRAGFDLLLLLGDRFEMFAAAAAAVPFRIPLAHLHGGEITEGAMDEQFRHALSKLSHLHFVSTERYRTRLLQLGEEPWRVVVSGAPALDHLTGFVPWSRERLEESLGMKLDAPPLLVTFHPVTLRESEQVDELLGALRDFSDRPLVITWPNSDMGYSQITQKLRDFVASAPNARLFPSLGTERYFSLMSRAAAMVGNSSSGIIEAASFELPVVNIGDRQKGRVRGENVVDAACGKYDIVWALRRALDPAFRKGLHGMKNPYGSGGASAKIIQALRELPEAALLLNKRFVDVAMSLKHGSDALHEFGGRP